MEVALFNRRFTIAAPRITFPPGSWDKRFTRTMLTLIERGDTPSERAQAQLYRIAHRYRRQIADKVLVEAAAAALDERGH